MMPISRRVILGIQRVPTGLATVGLAETKGGVDAGVRSRSLGAIASVSVTL